MPSRTHRPRPPSFDNARQAPQQPSTKDTNSASHCSGRCQLAESLSYAFDGNTHPCFVQLVYSLPDDVVTDHILSKLTPVERKSMRQMCQRARKLVNLAVRGVALYASDLTDLSETDSHAFRAFPCLKQLRLQDSNSIALTDYVLMQFLRASSTALAALQRVDIKRCHYLSAYSFRLLCQHCPGITHLSASRWSDATALSELAALSRLESLDLGDAEVDILSIDDQAIAVVNRLTMLTHLSMQRCLLISDSGLASLLCLPQLSNLNLSYTCVSGLGLSQLTTLRVLDVSHCRNFSDAALPHLQLPQLLDLVLAGTGISNTGLAVLPQLPCLAKLDLGSQFELNDEGFAALARCQSLKVLAFGNFNINQRLPNMGHASSSSSTSSSNSSNSSAARSASAAACGFPKLHTLHFGGAYFNKGVRFVFPLPALHHLGLSGFDTVSDANMAYVSQQPSLTTLELNGGYQLTAAGLATLSRLTALQVLHLSCCPHICEGNVRALLHANAALQQIQVRKGTYDQEGLVMTRE